MKANQPADDDHPSVAALRDFLREGMSVGTPINRETLRDVLVEIDRLTAAHARCTNLSNADAARIFVEAREMRERAEKAECDRDQWRDLAVSHALERDSLRADALEVENTEMRAACREPAYDGHAAPSVDVCRLCGDAWPDHEPKCILARPSAERGAAIISAADAMAAVLVRLGGVHPVGESEIVAALGAYRALGVPGQGT